MISIPHICEYIMLLCEV